MNKSDSERIASVLEKIDYRPTPKKNEADLIVVNMCSVRQSAVDRIYGLLPKFKKLKANNKKLKTVLTGCILKKDKKKFAENFDLMLSIKNMSKLPKFLKLKTKKASNQDRNYLLIKSMHKTEFSALIPISNGCNNFCTYCVVPYTRASLMCRNHKEILEEVKNVVQNKVKEIWLLGQNVNSYKSPSDSSINFAELLKQVNGIPGNFWIRFTSPHPKDFSDELIETMVNCEKITEYLNLPVQSGDNKILKKMNRPYTVEQYKNLVKKIREKIPEICLSTDAIVGFPGETEKQFQNTVKLFKEIKFDMAYISQYSPRPGTAAAKTKDNVSHLEKEKRWRNLSEVLKKTALKKNKKYIGKIVEVLVEKLTPAKDLTGKAKNSYLLGKTRNYKSVKLLGSKKLLGEIVRVKITDALPWSLKGKIV